MTAQHGGIKPELLAFSFTLSHNNYNLVRWSSLFDMLERLLKLEDFCERRKEIFPELGLTEEEWLEIKDLAEAMTLAKMTTKILQCEQLTLFSENR